MPFFYALPIAILVFALIAPAVSVRAEGLSVSSVFGDDQPGDSSDFRADRRDIDDWRRLSSRNGGKSDADRARGVAARELLEAIEDGVNAGSWIPFRHRKTRGQEILATLEQALPEEPSAVAPAEQSLRSRFRFHLARGIEYRQEIEVAEQPLKMRLYGPIVSGSPGLGFQLRGHVSERQFEVQAFGSTDEVGLEVHFDF